MVEEDRQTAAQVIARGRCRWKLGADPSAKDDRGNRPLNCASAKIDKRFESAIPMLNVKNVPAAIAYSVDKLGFHQEWDWGSPATFGCVFRDAVRIFLCEGAQGGLGTWISVFVHDVDALHADYQRRGAIIRQAPANFPWGLREMNVEDLDGHRLRLGSEATGEPDDVALNED